MFKHITCEETKFDNMLSYLGKTISKLNIQYC